MHLIRPSLFFGTFSAHSEETAKKFLIPPSIQGASPSGPKLIKVAPVKPGEEIPDWVARWELARVLSYAKRYDESITEYEKVLKEKPDLTEAKLEMAKVLFWKGDQKYGYPDPATDSAKRYDRGHQGPDGRSPCGAERLRKGSATLQSPSGQPTPRTRPPD